MKYSKSKSTDKDIERRRYQERAKRVLLTQEPLGNTNLHPVLDEPYRLYRRLIKKFARDKQVLEIGAGMGEHTAVLLTCASRVVITDIATQALEVARQRLVNEKLTAVVADMENLCFDDGSFDVVASAGSLSYGDGKQVMDEIHRVLKNQGVFICVDTLNHNPIYKFNRWIHYWRNHRTRSALNNMPTVAAIERYRQKFGLIEVSYFGAIVWMLPLLSTVFSDEKLAHISAHIDRLWAVKKSAFKFVMFARKCH